MFGESLGGGSQMLRRRGEKDEITGGQIRKRRSGDDLPGQHNASKKRPIFTAFINHVDDSGLTSPERRAPAGAAGGQRQGRAPGSGTGHAHVAYPH